ncbi:hypothetical protein [Streptomyces sp. NBC_01443]|uniref:hypothetical protein n=1 Tax=Streptomyces sp. NBC_01443 TaxID=2903868 RepID=UPI0022506E34|nr:hypothetical protein [Streptomyces sp. NBC_01443]MCX4632662.1 hypothetical protein [Streptomyces sp. NBC_01443]
MKAKGLKNVPVVSVWDADALAGVDVRSAVPAVGLVLVFVERQLPVEIVFLVGAGRPGHSRASGWRHPQPHK